MRDGKILIVGGYGAVGRVISTMLGNLFPGQVIVAGRNYQKAKEFSSELDQKVIPLELDITSISKDDERLSDVNLVIMCIDQRNTQFVTQCIQQGIHYIDISATYELLSEIESLNNEAGNHGTTVVLSVGLAPGLTNLLARHCKSKIQDMQYADIYIMLGFGEAHGEAAVRWTLENLNAEFSLRDGVVTKQVRSFENGKQTIFPDKIGKRTAYRFNFSDQHVIPRTLEINSASTWLCFDSRLITYLFAFLKKAGLSRIFGFRPAQNFLIKILKVFHFGSEQFVIKVEAGTSREQGALYECSLSGQGEGRIAGLVAAKVAEELYTSSFASGVFHIEQLFNPLEFIENLNGTGLKFEESALKGS